MIAGGIVCWGTLDRQKIKAAIDEAFSKDQGIQFRYPTVFEKAYVLLRELIAGQAFVHDCEKVALRCAIFLIEKNGYRFRYRPMQGRTLVEHLEACSTRKN